MKSTPTNHRCNLNLSRLVWPRVRWLFPVFAFGIALAAQPLPAEQATPNKDQPFLRAGKCEDQTPFKKKNISVWPQSPAFAGLRAANLPGAPYAGKDVVWYVNYSDKALYIKFLTTVDPNSENFIAKATKENDLSILDDDHIVVQVGFDEKVGQDGVPYFRMAMNPNGAVWAYTMQALEGQNHPLDTRAIGRGSWVGVDGARYWIGHLRIPLAMLGTDKLDGKTAKVHLAWSSKPLYLSWGGVKADDWRNAPQVTFDPDPLFSFALNKSNPSWLFPSGSLNLQLDGYAGTGTDDKPVDLKIAMRNEVNGKVSWEKTWEERKTKGQKANLGGREQIQGVAAEGNILRMEVTASYDGKEQLLLRNALPFSPKDAKVDEALAAWKKERSYEMPANAVFEEGKPDPLLVKPEAMAAWKDMRFGMFISWGPVSLTGREIGWSRGSPTPIEEYDALYKKWNPEKFDAKEWVKVAKETGCRYIVFLTKHHDGFCLWDTKQTDYNIMNGPFKRDVTKEIAAACKEQGVGFFPYYSTCDWHHPDFPVTSPRGRVKREVSNLEWYTDYLEAQCKELITGYGPLVGIWFDVPQCFDKARGERVIRFVRTLQPDIIVNNRTGAPGDFDTPEQTVGRCRFDRPWESCITLGSQWAWKPNDTVKPYTEAVKILVACAVGDGNLALNTNPMPDGQIEPRQVENFRKIGEWMGKYGESIYGTRGGPFVSPGGGAVMAHGRKGKFPMPEGPWWGGSTHKANAIYLHILRWPEETLKLPAIAPKIVKSSVLTGGQPEVKQTAEGITVSVPAAQHDAIDTIVKLELDGPAADIAPIFPKEEKGAAK